MDKNMYKLILCLVLLFEPVLCQAPDPATYWVSSSCNRAEGRFSRAFRGSIDLAARAARMLRYRHPLAIAYFSALFTPNRHAAHERHLLRIESQLRKVFKAD